MTIGMESAQLSICIATVNRATFLTQTLASIVPQLGEGVEVVVVDGASDDTTPSVVRSLQLVCPRLEYVRLDKRGGVDQDYAHAVSFARGKYCWLMTDDDLLRPGAVGAVLDAIKGDHSLIIVNAEVRTADLGRCVADRRLRLRNDRMYSPGEIDRLFVDTAKYLSFIGGVVIRRDIWNEREKERYFGSQFIHLGVIFQKTLPGTVLILAEPWIVIRYGNALWTSRTFEIWMVLWPDLIWSFGCVSDSAKRHIQPPSGSPGLKALLLLRAEGVYGMEEYRIWLAWRVESGARRLVAKAIARIPGSLLNVLALLYFHVFHRWSMLQLVDLWNSPYYYRRWLRGNLLPRRWRERR